ncbi:MAG TPA: hypothetical protein VGB53_08450 [Rubricoccaceae bacterium]|jgi:hypothetical protein
MTNPVLVALVAFCIAPAAFGQSPDAVAQAYYDASLTGHPAAAARLVHPDVRREIGSAIRLLIAVDTAGVLRGTLPMDWRATNAGQTEEGLYDRYFESAEAGPGADGLRSINAAFPKTTKVVGVVAEGDTTHVVLRVREAQREGAGVVEPQLVVVSVRASPEGPRVLTPVGARSFVKLVSDFQQGRIMPPPRMVAPAPRSRE